MQIIKADLTTGQHCQAVFTLLNEYLQDKMGLEKEFSLDKKHYLITGLKASPSLCIFLCKDQHQYQAMAVCYEGFSTFRLQPFLNIHDFVVHRNSRRKGMGKKLMEHIVEYATRHGFCKVTLEVRIDNIAAMSLYKKQGFTECDPPMHFWVRELHA